MSALDTFKKRMAATSGSSMRDEMIKNSKQLLQSTFLDDASANPYITFWNTETKLVCRIFGRKKSSSLVIATIQAYIDSTISVGDILYDSNDKEYWMCTNLFNVDDVHKQGELTLCNYTLKFQSPDGTILSYPCIDETNTGGLDENNVITLGESVHTIKLPFDEHTKLIDVDRRFFIDDLSVKKPKVFAVTNPNRTEFRYGDKGLIVLTMKASVLQENDGTLPKDRPDLGICNYFTPTVTPTPPTGTTYSTIVSSGELTLGTTRTLTVTCYNADKTVNTSITPVWVVIKPTGYESYISYVVNGNTCSITVTDDNYDMIDSIVKINVSDGNGGYLGSIDMIIGT